MKATPRAALRAALYAAVYAIPLGLVLLTLAQLRRIDDGAFELLGRDPAALPRGCSRAADEMLSVPS